MKFKKIEVSGFKSFADKLEIDFGAGITAIVGPNGCGKSNVADSIRWVLGEQSAKLLRGNTMQDVIFNGTENRKSLSFCEVSLFFDNSEKLFPTLDFNEVVVTRKLYRSGESEYLVNKNLVRLKDITSYLRDARMGREGYSIIGQGRIDELLSAKPEDRREIFEEAAGISKFKAGKKEAERRLLRTSENLTRVNDILEEKARQLDPLTKQSENARKWLDFRDRLKNYEINTYIHQFDFANSAKDTINTRLNGVIEELDIRQKESDLALSQYNEAMTALSSTDKSIENLREELLNLTVGLEKQAGEITLLNERRGYLSAQNSKLSEENIKNNEDYCEIIKYIEEGSKALVFKREQLVEKKTEYEKLSAEYLEIVSTLSSGEDEVELHHKTLVEAMDKLSDIKANMSRLIAEHAALESVSKDLNSRIKFNSDKLVIDTQTEMELKSEIEILTNNKSIISLKREKDFVTNNESLSKIAECASSLDSLNEKFYTRKTRHKMLKEMQEAYEGFAYSVKKLLQDAKTNKDLASKMEGVLAQLIKVEPNFETAIEMALGNAVQNIVTNNEEDAKFLIEYLKERKYGRVTFLPIAAIKPRDIEPRYLDLLKSEGCYGVATELIQTNIKYSGIVRGLLGSTVIVNNMDTAISLARKSNYGFKIVTLDGDIINPHGSITGGSKKSELTNIFGYEREIESLDIELKEIQSDIEKYTKERKETAEINAQAAERLRIARDKIQEIDVLLAGKTENRNKISIANEELKKLIEELETELNVGCLRFTEIDNDLNSVAALENMITSEKDNATVGGKEKQQQFESLRSMRDNLHNLMTNAKVSVTNLENIIYNTENEIKRLQDNIASLLEKIEYNNVQLSENNQLLEKIDNDMNSFTSSASQNDSSRVKEIRSELSNLDEFKQKSQEKVALKDLERMALVTKIQELFDKKNKEEMQLLKVDSDIEQMQQRVFEEYSLEYVDCLPFKEENYDINVGVQESNRIKRQMNSLGNINIDSIELCKVVYQSYNELNIQKEDLLNAQNDLQKVISDLSVQMLEMFTESFEKIRINFQKIFKELFDGGNADLILLENENQLEAGIEIVAQPPEKKLQSISLLSGGERALTAIAILFAILKLNPMPFCVLDEIEAALDDANASRFAKYLRRFSEETQFIVITHRKPTMELADSLYGVTMEEKGVSKVVSVKLSEAVAVAETSMR